MAVVCASSEKNALVKKSTAGKLKAVPTESGCLKRTAVKFKASDYVGLPNKSWTLSGLKKLLRKIDTDGTIERKCDSGRRRTFRMNENDGAVCVL